MKSFLSVSSRLTTNSNLFRERRQTLPAVSHAVLVLFWKNWVFGKALEPLFPFDGSAASLVPNQTIPVRQSSLKVSLANYLYSQSVDCCVSQGPVTPSTERVGRFSTGGEWFFNSTLVHFVIWQGGKRFYKPTLVPYYPPDHHEFFRMPRGL